MRTGTALAACLLALAVAMPRPAAADGSCEADAARLCSLIPAGDGRILTCLQTNYSNLSDDCKADLDRAKRLAYEVSLDCQADVFAYCQAATPGKGRVLSCLVGHLDQLSSGCKKGLALLREFQDQCGADQAALCRGIDPGGAQVLSCLLALKDRLSPGCRSFLRVDD
jgi:hypothetical protein